MDAKNLANFLDQRLEEGTPIEGYSQQIPRQVEFLKRLVNNKSISNVLEIGFNAGHSAEIFLSSNKDISLVSFDLGQHDYVKLAKEFIDYKYPGRHQLIIGDSLDTVPKYINKSPPRSLI